MKDRDTLTPEEEEALLLKFKGKKKAFVAVITLACLVLLAGFFTGCTTISADALLESTNKLQADQIQRLKTENEVLAAQMAAKDKRLGECKQLDSNNQLIPWPGN